MAIKFQSLIGNLIIATGEGEASNETRFQSLIGNLIIDDDLSFPVHSAGFNPS